MRAGARPVVGGKAASSHTLHDHCPWGDSLPYGEAMWRRQSAELLNKPLVYCEEWGKPLIHSQLWVRELVDAAGGSFLGEPGAVTTAEAVAGGDPEVIIAAWCGWLAASSPVSSTTAITSVCDTRSSTRRPTNAGSIE